jgi:hypothetical protein
MLVPFVDTLLSITVTRFAHDGMPVKSTLVPDALTAVPEISNVPFSLALLPTAAKAVAVMIYPLPTSHIDVLLTFFTAVSQELILLLY